MPISLFSVTVFSSILVSVRAFSAVAGRITGCNRSILVQKLWKSSCYEIGTRVSSHSFGMWHFLGSQKIESQRSLKWKKYKTKIQTPKNLLRMVSTIATPRLYTDLKPITFKSTYRVCCICIPFFFISVILQSISGACSFNRIWVTAKCWGILFVCSVTCELDTWYKPHCLKDNCSLCYHLTFWNVLIWLFLLVWPSLWT